MALCRQRSRLAVWMHRSPACLDGEKRARSSRHQRSVLVDGGAGVDIPAKPVQFDKNDHM